MFPESDFRSCWITPSATAASSSTSSVHKKSELEEEHDAPPQNKQQFIVPDAEEQINAIVHALVQTGVRHWDIHERNVCVREGKVYLIDFDVADHWDDPDHTMTERYRHFRARAMRSFASYGEYARTMLTNILLAKASKRLKLT